MAVSSMNVRRCIAATSMGPASQDGRAGPAFQAGLVMTRQAIERRPFLLVAVHAKPHGQIHDAFGGHLLGDVAVTAGAVDLCPHMRRVVEAYVRRGRVSVDALPSRSEEHTSELQSLRHLVCRLLLEKKKKKTATSLSR